MGVRKSELHVHLSNVTNKRREVSLTSNNVFFRNRELVYNVYLDKITFRVPNMEDRKKIVKSLEKKTCKDSFNVRFTSNFSLQFIHLGIILFFLR